MKYDLDSQGQQLQEKLEKYFFKSLDLYLLDEIDKKIKDERAKSSTSKSSIRLAIRLLKMSELHLTSIQNGKPLSLEDQEKTQQLIKVAYKNKTYRYNSLLSSLLDAISITIFITVMTVALAAVINPLLFFSVVAPLVKALKTANVLVVLLVELSPNILFLGIAVSSIYCGSKAAATPSGFFASSLKIVEQKAKEAEKKTAQESTSKVTATPTGSMDNYLKTTPPNKSFK